MAIELIKASEAKAAVNVCTNRARFCMSFNNATRKSSKSESPNKDCINACTTPISINPSATETVIFHKTVKLKSKME